MPTKRAVILLSVILGSHVFLLVDCALRSSICYDEGAHLTAGIAYLKYADMSIYNLTPPLLSMYAAIPAVIAGVDAPDPAQVDGMADDLRHWGYFELFQQRNLPRMHTLVLHGRFMMMPFSITAGLVLFVLARRIYSETAGLIATAAWCFSPTIIANGSIVGTDIATALTMFVACVMWMRFLHSRKRTDGLIAAGVIALAHLMKFTAILLWPALLAVSIIEIVRRRERWRILLFPGAAAAILFTLVLLNGIYGFSHFGPRIGSFDFVSRGMKSIQRVLPASLPLPFTRVMISGFDYQKLDVEGNYLSTLFDKGYAGSDWRYYPWVLMTRSTVGEVILLLLLAASFVFRRPTSDEINWLVILAIFWIFMTVFSQINIGIRYMLPFYPPVMLMMGRLAQVPKLRIAAIVAAMMIAVETLIAAPRFHSFVNVIAYPWRRWAPNQDYGQSLIDLRRWMDAHDVKSINLIYFGRLAPQAYGTAPAGLTPLPTTDYVAISKQMLCGYPPSTRDGMLFIRAWKQLLSIPPAAELDGMLVFRASDFAHLEYDPWIVRVQNRAEARSDPAFVPMRN